MFACKLPRGTWLNLASIRCLEIDTGNEVAPTRKMVLITWENGDKNIFYDEIRDHLNRSLGESKRNGILPPQISRSKIKGIDKSDVVLPPDDQA